MPIDLHSHTTASDGSLSPTELVLLAKRNGLTALAVTDHDTLDGLPEALAAAAHAGIELVPGIELDVAYPPLRKFHLLGLFVDPEDAGIRDRLRQLKANRASRNERMVERLGEIGVPVSMEDVAAESGGGQIGRPHVARALLKKGIVRTLQEAFDRYIADGAAAHVPKDKITLEEGIALIHGAGGVASMAHPLSYTDDPAVLPEEFKRMRALGLDAAECLYSAHTADQSLWLIEAARAAGLLVTCGSDYHGDIRPSVRLGGVTEGFPGPDWILDELKERRASARSGARGHAGGGEG
jgi:hypothetical protein